MYVCVCVCVCERERERGREGGREGGRERFLAKSNGSANATVLHWVSGLSSRPSLLLHCRHFSPTTLVTDHTDIIYTDVGLTGLMMMTQHISVFSNSAKLAFSLRNIEQSEGVFYVTSSITLLLLLYTTVVWCG